jgi:hypothetical protein
MFDLDQAIAEWRQQMRKAGFESPALLDELESHLRDDIAEQMRSVVGAQQAFEAAVGRIGHASALQAEFRKTGDAKKACERKVMQKFMAGAAAFYLLFVGACIVFKLGSFSQVTLNQQLSGSAATALTVLLAISGYLANRFFPFIPHKRTRVGIYAAGIVLLFAWLSIFYHLVMTRFEFDLSQFLVAFLWAWTPMGALCGVISGMEQAAVQKTTCATHLY